MKNLRSWTAMAFGAVLAGMAMADGPYAVSFTKLTGVTGSPPSAQTAVYRADLSPLPLSEILSISVRDNSFGLGGSPGRFSGFDLDAIILSNTSVATAAEAKALAGLNVFNYNPSATLFTPGTQRDPVDPATMIGPSGGTASHWAN